MWGSEEFPASYEAEGWLVSLEWHATLPRPETIYHSTHSQSSFNTEFGAIEGEIVRFGAIVLS